MDVRRLRPKQKPKIMPLDKKIKPNPRYQNVQPVTDTGNNTRKQFERMEELRQFYRFRPDEVFRRVTVTSLVGLMIEVSKLEFQEADAASEHKGSSARSEVNSDSSVGEPDIVEGPINLSEEVIEANQETPTEPFPIVNNNDIFESVVVKGKMMRRSTSIQSQLHSSVGDLIAGIGKIEIVRPHNQQLNSGRSFHHQNSYKTSSLFNYEDTASQLGDRVESVVDLPIQISPNNNIVEINPSKPVGDETSNQINDRPFLLLDVRQVEDFERCHIIMAKSYPASRLTRAVNFETREMLAFKNKKDKLIVVYDYDELVASKFATTLVQRGYDNVFMLSGGVRITQAKFPKCLIRRGELKPNGQEELFSEMELQSLERFLEEAQASGTGRMSSMSSVRLHSRLQSSLSNLPSLASGSVVGVPHSKRYLMHTPARSTTRAASVGRS